MRDGGPEAISRNGLESPAKEHLPFQRFLRAGSAWSWRAWVFFCCALVFCTMQAVPRWTHPSLLLDWDPSIYYGIIGASGAVTGLVVAQYRFPGLLAGALAGIGSVLTAVLVLEHINPFSRIVLTMVGVIGLLPGVAFYCVLHVVVDRLRVKLPEQGETFDGRS
jgi:hypothetical protein